MTDNLKSRDASASNKNSVFTNIEEYQLFQIGEYLVVEGTHVKQVIQVLVGALDYHFLYYFVYYDF